MCVDVWQVRETEMDKDQVEIKLNQKEEENRIKGRKISDLIFKVMQVEEECARLTEELVETKAQLAKSQSDHDKTLQQLQAERDLALAPLPQQAHTQAAVSRGALPLSAVKEGKWPERAGSLQREGGALPQDSSQTRAQSQEAPAQSQQASGREGEDPAPQDISQAKAHLPLDAGIRGIPA